jgi:hypothetical protein
VPTPDKILLINGYFSKIAVLIRKKPCNLAGLYLAPKKDGLEVVRRNPVLSGIPWRLKNFKVGTVRRVFFDLTGISRIWQGNQCRRPGMGIPADPFSSMFLSY